MGTRRADAALWKQVDKLLQRRPAWRFQARSTPGSSPVWCLGPEHDPDLSLAVAQGAIHIHVASTDCDETVADADELVEWLAEHRPGVLGDQRPSRLDRLGRSRLFEWE